MRDAFASINRFIETTFSLGMSPQCNGINRSSGAQPPVPPLHGTCQRDGRPGSDDLYNTIKIAQAPTPFSPIAMTMEQRILAVASSSDNGALLSLSRDVTVGSLSFHALPIAHALDWDSLGHRLSPLENDEGER